MFKLKLNHVPAYNNTYDILLSVVFFSRVHITQDVLDVINGDYEVEEGHGSERDIYLKEHDMKTYLVSEKHSKDRVSNILFLNYRNQQQQHQPRRQEQHQ